MQAEAIRTERPEHLDAEGTARRVLLWITQMPATRFDPRHDGAKAARAANVAPPFVPSGPLSSPRSLATPSPATLALLGEMVRDAAARLGAGSPPFGDPGPIGLGALFLAAAVGGRWQPEAAQIVAEALRPPAPARPVPAPGAWADAMARHAVVAPVLGHASALAADEPIPDGDEEKPSDAGQDDDRSAGLGGATNPLEALAESLLRLSPLTAVLHRPAASGQHGRRPETVTHAAMAIALAARPRGAEVLRTAIARWSADPAVLSWRTDLLTRLGTSPEEQHRALVADTYTVARLRHGSEWDSRIRTAARALARSGQPDALSLATVRYWSPLEALARRDPDLLRMRPLLTGEDRALKLVRRYRLDVAGTA